MLLTVYVLAYYLVYFKSLWMKLYQKMFVSLINSSDFPGVFHVSELFASKCMINC